MSLHPDYRQFLADKVVVASPAGFEIDDAELHPSLKPIQRVAVRWMLRGAAEDEEPLPADLQGVA